MNRRTAIKTMAASLASFIIPAPRPRLDLKRFCARTPYGVYDLKLPYTLADYTYATDGYACLRVRPASGDVVQHEGKIPPLESLSWNHDALRGWRTLPRLEAMEADDSPCSACEGFGFMADGLPACAMECERCGGTGHVWVGSGYVPSVPVKCKRCKGVGHLPPPGAVQCPACCGKAFGRFPSVVRLDGRYYRADLYRKWQALGAEFVQDIYNSEPEYPLLKLRAGDDGDGLLMGMDAAGVERRLVKGGKV